MRDDRQTKIRCNELKPDFVAGPFQYCNGSVVSMLSSSPLEEIAAFLSTLKRVPGTRVHPLPFVVGELNKQGTESRAEDV